MSGFSVDERKAKVPADRASRDDYYPSMQWKDLQHDIVAVEDTQNSFECHAPTVPEDDAYALHLNYNYK